MSGGTLTPAHPIGVEDGGYVVRAGTIAASVDILPYHASSTRLARMAKGVVLPLLVSVAWMGAPVPAVRRVFADAAISRSALADLNWPVDLDEFFFTEETANAAEVRALNALLELPLMTGFELDLPE